MISHPYERSLDDDLEDPSVLLQTLARHIECREEGKMKIVIELNDQSITRRALVVATAVLRAQAAEDGDDIKDELDALVHLKRQLYRAPTIEEYDRTEVIHDTWRGVSTYPDVEVNSVGKVRSKTTKLPLKVIPADDIIGANVKLKDRSGKEDSVMVNWLVERAFGIQIEI